MVCVLFKSTIFLCDFTEKEIFSMVNNIIILVEWLYIYILEYAP